MATEITVLEPQTRSHPVHGVATRGKAARIMAGTAALGVLALVTAGCGFPSGTAASADDPGNDTAIVECRSGVVTDGDVQTSSLSVTLVTAAQLPELPGGCSVVP
jgi:hypothetical protein